MQQPQRPVNLRDLGGIPGADGRRVVPLRLLRAGEPTGLSNQDAALLTASWQVKKVVDLRTLDEVRQSPNTVLKGVRQYGIDLTEPGGLAASGAEISAIAHRRQVEDFMKGLYRSFVTSPTTRAGLHRLFEILLGNQEGAVLFHCYAGKDRTGIAAAVILTALGADKEAVFADYLRTNAQRAQENARVLQGLKAQGASDDQLEGVGAALGVEAVYLQECYTQAQQLYGSFDCYIEKGIGLNPEQLARLRGLYLE